MGRQCHLLLKGSLTRFRKEVKDLFGQNIARFLSLRISLESDAFQAARVLGLSI